MTDIVKREESTELFVFARNPEEMSKAQTQLIGWAEGKIDAKHIKVLDRFGAKTDKLEEQKTKLRSQLPA